MVSRSKVFRKRHRKPFGFDSRKKKICRFCENKAEYIDYKEERLLRRFVNERGKIIPRRITGNCAKHQRELTRALKRARQLALIAYRAQYFD